MGTVCFGALLLSFAADFDTAFKAGLAALNQNDLAGAQTQLESAAKLAPARGDALLALAQVYFRQGKLDLALQSAKRSEKVSAGNSKMRAGLAIFHQQVAQAYAASGKLPESAAEFQQVLRLRPETEASYFQLAEQQLRLERFAPALETLHVGLKRFPNSAQLELGRGVALYGLRRFPQAIDSFLRVTKLAPEVEQPYRFLGRMIDVAEGKLPEVTSVFAQFAKNQPSNSMSQFLYAKALSMSAGDAAEVEALLRKSIALDDKVWESHFELGLALERRQAFPEAAAELERAAQLRPDEPAPHYRLARVYDRLGRASDAAAEREIHSRLTSQAKSGMELAK